MKIEGKVALVTGGASGIWKAVSKKLLEKGVKFVAVIDFDDSNGQKLLGELSANFGADRVRFIQCDVTDEKRLKESFQEAYDVHQALDIVVNNAGIMSKDHIKTINVNLVAIMNGILIANELMTKTARKEKGVIINTSSMAGLKIYPLANFSYSASKHGVVGLTKAFPNSADRFSKDLRAVAICPAGVVTDILTRNEFITKQMDARLQRVLAETYISMDMVTGAYIRAVEDDELNGAIISVEPSGVKVTYGEKAMDVD